MMHAAKSTPSQLRTVQLIWGVFLINPMTFGAVLMFTTAGDPSVDPTLMWALVATAVFEVPVLFFVRWQTLGHLALFEPQDLRETDIADESVLVTAVKSAAARYFTGSIISFALCESILLMGFVASYLSGAVQWFAGTTILFWILMVIVRPRMVGVMCLMTAPERQALRRMAGG